MGRDVAKDTPAISRPVEVSYGWGGTGATLPLMTTEERIRDADMKNNARA